MRREPFERRHVLTGELVAERAIDIVAPDVGIRPLEIRRMVESGTPVEAGDLLFAYDNSELAAGLEEQRVALLEARTGLVTAESQSGSTLAQAKFEVERRRAARDQARIDAAIPPGLKSAEEYQRLQLELSKAESRLADAQQALDAAIAVGSAQEQLQRLTLEKSASELARLEEGIAGLQLVAPASGVVLVASNSREDRRWQIGDVLFPGELMATLPDLTSLIVRARLFDVDDDLIEAGAPAAVILDAFPDTVIAARIRHIDPMALQWEKASTSRIFWVTIELEELDLERMKPGMSAMVVVGLRGSAGDAGKMVDIGPESGRPVDPLVAPRSSLDLADPGRARLRLADGSWREVKLGSCDHLRCVIEAGAEEGTRLAWAGSAGAGQ